MASNVRIADGSYDFSQGVDSGSVPTVRSANNPNGLPRTALAWLTNATVRGGGITPRNGWQALVAPLLATGLYQGGYLYAPPYANPYLVFSVSGIIYSVTLSPPYTLTNLTATAGPPFSPPNDYLEFFSGSYPAFEPRNPASVMNPATAPQVWMCQAEQFLIIQAGDLFNPPIEPTGLDNWRLYYQTSLTPPTGAGTFDFTLPSGSSSVSIDLTTGVVTYTDPNLGPGQTLDLGLDLPIPLAFETLVDLGPQPPVPTATLPLFWDGTNLWRSRGIISANNTPNGGIFPYNEIPAATAMCYYQGHLWYAQGRTYTAGDTVGNQSSGSLNYNYTDSVLRVTENPLATGGDGFTVPTQAGNIQALAFTANLDVSLGQGQLYIFTRQQIYALTVPANRSAWIAANANNQPLQTLAQEKWGATSDRCVVPVNGDLFYQSLEPAIRSLFISIRYFQQWGNVPISRNINRVLGFNDRSKMQFATGIQFNNRLLQGLLPIQTPVGVAFQAIAALDFDIISAFAGQFSGNPPPPAWEGIVEGLDILQLFSGDFGGSERAFAMVHSRLDDSIALWELTDYLTTDINLTGSARINWAIEFPAYTWAHEFDLKNLDGGEIWVDNIQGQVDAIFYYREDANPCWTLWFEQSFCSAQNSCATVADPVCYPIPPNYCQGYRFPITFPKPQPNQNSPAQKRQSTRGYQFQVRAVIKGWCRVRGIIQFALPLERAPYEGLNS